MIESRIFEMKRLIASGLAIVSANFLMISAVSADVLFSPLTNVQNMSNRAEIKIQGTGKFDANMMHRIFNPRGDQKGRTNQVPLQMLDGSESILRLRVEQTDRADGIRILNGVVDGERQNPVTLTNDNGRLRGRLWKDGKLFRINGDRNGAYRLSEVQANNQGRGEDTPEARVADKQRVSALQKGATAGHRQRGPAPRPGEPIDLLIYITEKAEKELGGREKAVQEINLQIAETNNILRQSRVADGPVFRIVKIKRNVIEENRDPIIDLNDWAHFKPYIVERDKVGADLVSFITSPDDYRLCGWSFAGPEPRYPKGYPELGFSITVLKCMLRDTSLSEELGRNLGAGYSRNFDWQEGINYAHVNMEKKWLTMMAFGSDCWEKNNGDLCLRIPFFSNPRLTYNGDPMGVPENAKLPADNVAAMRTNLLTIASYRPRAAANGAPGSTRTKVGGIVVESTGTTNGKTGKERKIKW
jgi:hypothetical protein